jgi:hypothetical protein
MKLPSISRSTFVVSRPFRGNVSETKKKLKAMSVKAASLLCVDRSMQEMAVAIENPSNMWLALHLSGCSFTAVDSCPKTLAT